MYGGARDRYRPPQEPEAHPEAWVLHKADQWASSDRSDLRFVQKYFDNEILFASQLLRNYKSSDEDFQAVLRDPDTAVVETFMGVPSHLRSAASGTEEQRKALLHLIDMRHAREAEAHAALNGAFQSFKTATPGDPTALPCSSTALADFENAYAFTQGWLTNEARRIDRDYEDDLSDVHSSRNGRERFEAFRKARLDKERRGSAWDAPSSMVIKIADKRLRSTTQIMPYPLSESDRSYIKTRLDAMRTARQERDQRWLSAEAEENWVQERKKILTLASTLQMHVPSHGEEPDPRVTALKEHLLSI